MENAPDESPGRFSFAAIRPGCDGVRMARQHVRAQADSQAPPEAVWRLLADVTTWPEWAGFHETSYEREGSPAPHGLGAVRRLRMGRLRSRETVLAFDPPRDFAYDYVGTLPFKEYRGDVRLSERGDGTHIEWVSEFTAKWPLVGPLLRIGMTRVLADISSRLARAAEASPGAG